MAQENLGIDLQMTAAGDLAVSGGDLEVTVSGRVTLAQDVLHLLATLPGDLFMHPTYGAGAERLHGEEDIPEYQDLMCRAISDALVFDASVAPRIEPDSVEVVALGGGGERAGRFRVSFVPIGEAWTNKMNLVWGSNADAEDL